MREGKRKFIEDAAMVIDGRVAALKAEESRYPNGLCASDRAAIFEAEHCASLIRMLLIAPYRSNPYKVARERWSRGGKL